MRIGVLEELKNHEYRAAIPSAGVLEAVRRGHQGGALTDHSVATALDIPWGPSDEFMAG